MKPKHACALFICLLCAALLYPPLLTAFRTGPSPWRPRLVIVVAVDTCRADHLGCYGYTRPTSPNIDRVAAGGTLFENAYSQSNESLFSYASILTGHYSRRFGPLSHVTYRLPATSITMPSTLSSDGVQTAAFVAGGHLDRQFGFSRGFDSYEDRWSFGSFFHTFPPAFDRIDAAAHTSAPLLLFLHGYDLHEPYGKPMVFDHLYDRDYSGPAERIVHSPGTTEGIYRGRFYARIPTDVMAGTVMHSTEAADPLRMLDLLARQHRPSTPLSRADIDHVVAAYDGAVSYADTWIGLLMARLQQDRLCDQTLLIIFGDHGEELMENGIFAHRINLTEPALHVPLIVWGPGGVPRGQRVAAMVELRELMPTVLDYFGLRPAPDGVASLRPLIEGRPPAAPTSDCAISEAERPAVSIRRGSFRLNFNPAATGATTQADFARMLQAAPLDTAHWSLYDIAHDPLQRRNVLTASMSTANTLRRLLVERIRSDAGESKAEMHR